MSNSTSSSTQLLIFTPIPFFGILHMSCTSHPEGFTLCPVFSLDTKSAVVTCEESDEAEEVAAKATIELCRCFVDKLVLDNHDDKAAPNSLGRPFRNSTPILRAAAAPFSKSLQSFLLYTILNIEMAYALSLLLIISVLAISSSNIAFGGNFYQDFDLTWGNGRAKILNRGQLLTLSLDRASGSGFRSKNQYLYGKIDMQIKLVPGNSAGTVTSYYLRSDGLLWDEIDFEFLGNLTGHPYTLHTNVYTQGKGDREQQFHLWFDPTAHFHTYSVLWNSQRIIFYVDGTPVREFKNLESKGVPYPKRHPMRIYSSIWNADDWATRGGLVKIDWSQAPFTASYRNFNASACVWSSTPSGCSSKPNHNAWLSQVLDLTSQRRLAWVQRNYMIYNYCRDRKRFPRGLPPECTGNGDYQTIRADIAAAPDYSPQPYIIRVKAGTCVDADPAVAVRIESNNSVFYVPSKGFKTQYGLFLAINFIETAPYMAREGAEKFTSFTSPFKRVTSQCPPEDENRKKEVEATLGRPWNPYSAVAILDSYIDSMVVPAGWKGMVGQPVDKLTCVGV
ncbi:hypothetical protein L6164_014080 [Bauhinia variegata]|uniref:Uncharacterized protein n=1 Tax=Bauhinia variegata TaxID=167791 RepID=A0ACB9NGR4_BAUVA|nr:hypothetical protein L6164_014080 [Bauhinia variegata]